MRLLKPRVVGSTGRLPAYISRSKARIKQLGWQNVFPPVKLAAVYSSPFERCLETAEAITAGRSLDVHAVSDLGEVDYGEWTGRTFNALRRPSCGAGFINSPPRSVSPGVRAWRRSGTEACES